MGLYLPLLHYSTSFRRCQSLWWCWGATCPDRLLYTSGTLSDLEGCTVAVVLGGNRVRSSFQCFRVPCCGFLRGSWSLGGCSECFWQAGARDCKVSSSMPWEWGLFIRLLWVFCSRIMWLWLPFVPGITVAVIFLSVFHCCLMPVLAPMY